MIDATGRAWSYFGVTNLDFRLTKDSRQRILSVSFLPFVVLCAMLVNLSLDLYFGRAASPFNLPPEGWQRILNASDTLSGVLPFISLAVLFLAGISRWSRAEGSWMLVAGVGFIIASLAAAAVATAIRAVELDSAKQFDLRVYIWARWAANFGMLAVGYCFVGYRGLAASQRRQAPRRRERPGEEVVASGLVSLPPAHDRSGQGDDAEDERRRATVTDDERDRDEE